MLIEHRDGFITSFDGLKLYEQSWIPEADRKGVLLFVHGYGEHSDRYRWIAEYFVPRNWVIFTYDQRGHGRSQGRRAHVADFNHYLDDLALMVRRADDINDGGKPIFIIGHSMGGLVTSLYMGERDVKNIKGFVLSSPMMRLAMKVPEWKKGLGKMMSGLYPTLSLENGIKAEYLSHDDNIVVRYERDPLVNSAATARWFTEAVKSMDKIFTLAPSIKTPALVMHGTGDKIISPSGTEEFFARLGSSDKKIVLFPEYYHEIFNEIGRFSVYEEMEGWLNDRCS